MAPGALTLCSCYSLGHQPLPLAQAAGALRARGYQPVLLDAAVQRPTPAQLGHSQLLALAVPMHTALRLGMEVARTARALGNQGVICFLGLYAPLNAEYLLAHGADVVLGAEFLEPLVNLVDALHREPDARRALERLRGTPGVWLPGHPPPETPLRRTPQPPVDRTGLPPLSQYVQLREGSTTRPVGYVETTRGCKHTCRHCPLTPVYGGRFLAVDREQVLQDIDNLVQQGATHVTFGDPDFLNGPTHAVRITEALHARHPGVTWDATIKVEHVVQHAALFPRFRETGCLFVVSAVESLSPVVLDKLAKQHTAADVAQALAVLRGAGISMRPTFVPFTPWTTREDYLEMARFLVAQELLDAVDPVQLAVRLLLPPHSALLPLCQGEPWLGPLDAENFTHPWTHPDGRMETLAAAMTRLAAQGAAEQADSVATVRRMLTHAFHFLEAEVPPGLAELRPARNVRAPGLTETWFC